MVKREEDPNKPFSVARVAVWALGVIGLVAVIGLVLEGEEIALRSAVQTAVGGLVAVAAAKVSGGR